MAEHRRGHHKGDKPAHKDTNVPLDPRATGKSAHRPENVEESKEATPKPDPEPPTDPNIPVQPTT